MNTDHELALRPPMGGPYGNWRLVGTVAWGLGVGLLFVVIQTIATLVVVLRGETDVGEDKILALLEAGADDGFALSMATFASTLICVPVLIGIAMLKKDSDVRDYFALKPVSTRSLMPWLGILALFIVVSDALTVVLGRPVVPEFLSAAYSSAGSLPLLWVALVVAAPLFEEMFFRGFLFKGFASSVVGVPGAIAITAFLWAAIHMQYDLYGMATIFVLGIVYGLARAWSGSLVVPLILHAVTNLVATAEAALIG
jgi:CAAX protease family protein